MSEKVTRPRRSRRIALHLTRVCLFVLIISLVRLQHARIEAERQRDPVQPVDPARLHKFFPEAESITETERGEGRHEVLDSSGAPLGYLLQTSPASDHLIGFSGPTNTLIAFGRDDRIAGIDVLHSGDTRDHVAQVLADEAFLASFNGLTKTEAATRSGVDAVSGATLTSLTIQESIIHRLSGARTSLRFPDPLTIGDVQPVLDSVHTVEQDEDLPSLWLAKDERGREVGSILRTSPSADNIVGYQGPTEARIFFDPGGRIVGLGIGNSYDNAEYVSYVRDDDYFRSLFNDLTLDELAELDLQEYEVEGVSGATMTSMAVANGLIAAAEQQRQAIETAAQSPRQILNWSLRDFGTAAVIVVGIAIALTSLRGNKLLRWCFHFLLIGYLGLVNGDMLSQAMIVGWAQNGVPWTRAGGLVLLTVAAFVAPITTRRNVYCTHLCPHGAAQHVLKDRFGWRLRLPSRLRLMLRVVPSLLLLWCLVVAMASLPFSLVDIEPFDAWVFRVAGWATVTIAIVGLVASLFVPMAYCRYGCPTGAMLSFLRFNSRSDRWSRRDWFVITLLVVAFGFWKLA